MSEESTNFLRQKYPVVLIIINVMMKRLEMILTNLLVALAVIYFEHGHVQKQIHTQVWNETGKHFQDLVQTNNVLADEIKKVSE